MSSCSTRAEPRSPWISVRFEQAWIGARGGLDRAQGPVLEPQAGHGGVFDLDAMVGQSRRLGHDRLDVAHQPVQEVDVVDRLVHECPAAVEVPGAPPAARVVILLGSPPLHVGVSQGQAAESATCDGLLEANVGRREPRREDRAEANAGRFAGLDDRVAPRQRDLQRLLDDHVLAGAGRLDGRISMGAAGSANADDIQPRVRKHRVQVVIDRAAVPGHPGDLLGVGPGAAEGGHHAGAGYLVDRPGVKLGDHPAANEAKTMLSHARSPVDVRSCRSDHG